WGISPRQPSGKNIIRWLLKKRTNGSVRYCQYTSIAVSGLPELPDMPFCDFFIRRQQFIYPGVPPTKSGEE
ncbi:hypothetical protein ACVTM7_25630, partial [Escherichia coli]